MGNACDCHEIPVKMSITGDRTASENIYFPTVRQSLVDTKNVGFFFFPHEK